MKVLHFKLLLPALILGLAGKAQNPVIQTKYTADPAPMVYHDTVYLYTSHDEDDAPPGQGKFLMRNWLCYTSADMVNWTDQGEVASLKNFKWADKALTGWGGFDNGAWAPQTVERNGKFYMYCPVQGRGIGVLVSNSPLGPFKDPIGGPLIGGKFDSIDPTVLIDDDGQAYLYWGNPNLWYVKLNQDMISLAGEITKDSSVAKRTGQPDPFHYQEGPWAYKLNGSYYMAYASTCCPEGIGYAMSKSATGPWEFKGYIMKPDKGSTGNHPGIIAYKGKSYVFGFNYRLNFMQTPQHHERRSVCVAELKYNPDGTIIELPWWQEEGVAQIGTLNPFVRNEAETIAWEKGVSTERDSLAGMFVTRIDSNDYIQVRGVNFTRSAKSFNASVSSAYTGGTIEIRLDSLKGKPIGTCVIKGNGGSNKWLTKSCKITAAKGVHDLYFVFKGGGKQLFNLNWWKFN
ncbi:glycoside hydrolase family 43 protein [Mucilaginibacter sp. PAMB04274]|uniref:glycoside hydrolase family 43 protein n=1 Tax=Mucilaginibacter sp. PAMB04274 TaxID=3138568 RepID=UPI0031F6D21E